MNIYPPYSTPKQYDLTTKQSIMLPSKQSRMIPKSPSLSFPTNSQYPQTPTYFTPKYVYPYQNAFQYQPGTPYQTIHNSLYSPRSIPMSPNQNYSPQISLSSPKKFNLKNQFDSLYNECLNKIYEERKNIVSPSKKHFGKLKEEKRVVYEGEIIDGKKNGYGALKTLEKMEIYNGEWKMNQFHGIGTLNNLNSENFQENFDYSDFSNLGNKWKKYEGEFFEGKKQGFGTIHLSNGENFSGHFENDQIHGEGTFTAKNGEIIIGKWRENKIIMSL